MKKIESYTYYFHVTCFFSLKYIENKFVIHFTNYILYIYKLYIILISSFIVKHLVCL